MARCRAQHRLRPCNTATQGGRGGDRATPERPQSERLGQHRWKSVQRHGPVGRPGQPGAGADSPDGHRHGARLGQPSRYCYNPRIAVEPTLVFDGWIKYDLESGTSKIGNDAFMASKMKAAGAAPMHGAAQGARIDALRPVAAALAAARARWARSVLAITARS